jgi:hypothetical protein
VFVPLWVFLNCSYLFLLGKPTRISYAIIILKSFWIICQNS